MSGVLSKIKGAMGFEEMDYSDEENSNYEENEETGNSRTKKGKIVNIHNASTTKVLIIKPKDYNEAKDIADAIKEKKIVLINTIALEQKVAQRIIDFIGGACYVLGGDIQEVEERIYILTPANTEVLGDSKLEPIHKTIFNWNKEE